MISSAIDQRIKLEKAFWFCVIVFGALAIGYLLAADQTTLAMCVGGLGWLMTLPYHARISVYLGVSAFSSALILPLFPGRPFWWEFAALLGWSGIAMTVAMREYASDFVERVKANRWIFIGMLGYCAMLIITMYYRGVGLRILGSGQVGGRFYFQQLSCVVFPFLFLIRHLEERTLVRLFIIQCLLTFTYLVSDFVFSIAPQSMYFLLYFFELPGDAVGFEMNAARFGVRRFQSLYMVGTGLFFLLMVFYNVRHFFSLRAFVLVPATAAVLTAGMLSGHRYLAVIITGTVLFCAISQRFFTLKNTSIGLAAGVLLFSFIYALAERAPLAVQRVVSVLPGIRIDTQARQDGDSTMETRRMLRKIGMDWMPTYFWIGRGFGLEMNDSSVLWDPTTVTMHASQGRFFNGFIGLMVNTGVFGTVCMGIFLLGGTYTAWRIIKHLRTHGCEDNFSRLCAVISGWWMASAVAFLFLHGDSEYAMKTFSLQAGMLLACERCLLRRLKVEAAAEGE
jgi:hypothetical protein